MPNDSIPEDFMARSMNSEAFSQLSMPSNNFVNGLKVNVPQRPQEAMMASMTSNEFTSMMQSNPTVNNMSVNLSKPLGSTFQAPL